MTNRQWPMTGDRGAACRPRSPGRTVPLRFLGPALARTAGHDISHWALGIHWSLGIGHWAFIGHWALGMKVNGPARRFLNLAFRLPAGRPIHTLRRLCG